MARWAGKSGGGAGGRRWRDRRSLPSAWRVRFVAAAVPTILGLTTWLAPWSEAFPFLSANAIFSNTIVGQTFTATYGINNSSTPDATTAPDYFLGDIRLVPACQPSNPASPSAAGVDCSNGTPQPGIYDLAPGPATTGTGTGEFHSSSSDAGVAARAASCEGTWAISPVDNTDPNLATVWRFTPPHGEGTLHLASGETCVITFTVQTLRVPRDANTVTPGVQTVQATGVQPIPPPGLGLPTPARSGSANQATIASAQPGLSTAASQSGGVPPPTPPAVPGTTADTATLSPPPPPAGAFGAPPAGTITFKLFGPFAAGTTPTCTGTPFNTQTVTVNGGGDYTTPAPVNIATTGTYTWVATYSGDVDYIGSSSACGDPAETITFALSVTGIITTATPTITLGSTANDTATLTGGTNPTGTITFTVFGPANPTCTGAPVFTSSPVSVNGNGTYTSSPPFTPTQPGTYNWVASYSGDANNASAASACGDVNESTTVTQATVTTSATPAAPLGSPVTDTATVAGSPGSPAPTGTVTFTLFANATCTGTPVFTSAAVPLSGGPPPTANAGNFTPTAPGTFNWVAAYSGDTVYAPVTGTCGAPDEASVVRGVAVATSAAPAAQAGSPISDTATVTAIPAGGPAPTGTVTFTLFDNATCTGAPVFASGPQPLAGGPPTATATSGPFTPPAAGTYRWVASYSGDANYAAVSTACNDANETSVVSQLTPVVVTQATAAVTVGQPVTDTATITGPAGPAPTGTVTFTVFGPNDATCTSAAVFASGPQPVTGGPPTATAGSGPFTPTAAGTYRWVASYSGDANYAPATLACNDANETSVVSQLTPVVATTATPTATVGQAVTDTATVTGPAGGPAPTGTLTFSVFGPDNATCTGASTFTGAPQALSGGLPTATATSAPFAPAGPGAYRWVVSYSGDATYSGVTTACNDVNETSVVAQGRPTIVTTATPAAALGQPISDAATLRGGVNPTGAITFRAFGPNDAACTGTPAFSSTVPVNGSGTYTSAPFTAPTDGAYRWVADYSGDVANQSVGTACGDPNETSVVAGAADLSIAKTCDRGPVPPATPVNCTVSVSNAGPSPAQNVSVTENLPAGMTLTGPASGGGFTCGTGSPFVCTRPALAAGETATLVFAVQAPENTAPGSSFTNSATVTSATRDPGPGPNTATATTTIVSCTISGAGAIVGTEGNDVICGSPGPDQIAGLGGDDIIFGFGGDDWLSGGPGNDTVFGGDGDDALAGDAGNDRLFGGPGDDRLATLDDTGGDSVDGGDHVVGDVCAFDTGDVATNCEMTFSGRPIPTTTSSTTSTSTTTTTTTTTTVPSTTTTTTVPTTTTTTTTTSTTTTTVRPTSTTTSPTTSTVVPPRTTTSSTTTVPVPTCDGLPATIVGTSGNDTIVGTPGNDVIVGLGGDDAIDGGGGDDRICGGDGNDRLSGGDGNDRLFGDAGADAIDGGDGNDALFGGPGLDRLAGGAGDDTLDGGADVDTCAGGPGTDIALACEGVAEVP